MPGEVGEVGQAPADQLVDLDALDRARPGRVAVARVLDRQARDGRADEQVVVGEHRLQRVEHLGAHRLVAREVEHRQPVAGVEPVAVLRRQVVAQVEPLRAQELDRRDVDRHDQPRPQVAQLALVVPDAELDLLHVRARVLERAHGAGDDRRHAPVDREDVQRRAVRDPHPGDVAVERGGEVDLLVEAERVARVVAGERGHAERRVRHGAGDHALEQERVRAAEAVRPDHRRHAPPRLLVAVDAAPGGGDPDRAAAVGALGDRQQAVGHGRRGAAGRPAAVARRVERVARRPEQVVVGAAAQAHHRAVGLADDDRAGALHPLRPRRTSTACGSRAAQRIPPNVAGQPGLKSNRSLIAVGTPCSGPTCVARGQPPLGRARPPRAPRRTPRGRSPSGSGCGPRSGPASRPSPRRARARAPGSGGRARSPSRQQPRQVGGRDVAARDDDDRRPGGVGLARPRARRRRRRRRPRTRASPRCRCSAARRAARPRRA